VTFASKGGATDEDPAETEVRRKTQMVARIIANQPPAKAAEIIVSMMEEPRAENPGAGALQEEQRWEACDSCGALLADPDTHRDWHYAMTWGEYPT